MSIVRKMAKKERVQLMRVISYALASALRNVMSVDVRQHPDPGGEVWHEVTIRFYDKHWGRKQKRST